MPDLVTRRHAEILPSDSFAATFTRIGDPSGSEISSSFLVHWTRTAFPGNSRASMTASIAASSAPL